MLPIAVYAVRFTQTSSWYFGNIALNCRKVILSCFPVLNEGATLLCQLYHLFFTFNQCILLSLKNLIKFLYIEWHFGSHIIIYVIHHIMQRYAETSKQRLDLAILVFFQNFRKSYVGDQAIHSSKVHYWKFGCYCTQY